MAFAFVLAIGGLAATAAAQPLVGLAPRPDTVTVHTDTGDHVFTVEWALTPQEMARGLMFRTEMAEDHGMVFDYGTERTVSFWMRNTYLSLDMIFVRADGTVHRIAEYTTPLSDDSVPSGAPVRYVFEVLAGTADRIGLKPGDMIDFGV